MPVALYIACKFHDEWTNKLDNWINTWNSTHCHRGHGMNGKTPDVVFEENWKIKRILPKEKYEFVFSETRIKHVSRCAVVWDNLLQLSCS